MTPDTYWAAVEPSTSLPYLLPMLAYLIKPLLAPGKTVEEMAAVVAPMIAKFDELGVKYTSDITHSTFLEGYEALFGPEVPGVNMITSPRLTPREHAEADSSAAAAAPRNGADKGHYSVGHAAAPSQFGGVSTDTSVDPVRKKGLLLLLYNILWNGAETQEQQWAVIRDTINNVDATFKDVSPRSGAYINEVYAAIPYSTIRNGGTTFTVLRIRGC